MKPLCNVSQRLPRSYRLLAALACVSISTTCAAGVDFELKLWHGYDYYYGDARLTASSPAPVTYHRVESPNGLIWQNAGSDNTGSSSSLSETTDVAALVNEITNGTWALTLNVGDASEQQYAFSIDLSGVDAALFGDAVITAPLQGASVASNPPMIEWTGPTSFPTINIYVSLEDFPYTLQDYETLPGAATSWTLRWSWS